ncbi:MAG: type II toxin-antitoxin system VapC family toxin [Desulfobacteraceae bacterium]|nr:type II toxin-antitoxin system VapC family toxin [Desulfobacteraceae bacterium]MBC2720079.1 type II toxin-antitoxin system VapC family toxin [Desulfobacteraceae bacterium]
MKLLLDTHVFIWWSGEPDKLSAKALNACENSTNRLILSIVSIWEMQIKMQLGKLKLKRSLKDLIENQQDINNLQILPVSPNHIFMLDNLPMHHSDPFDRLLISQAIEEKLALVSKDQAFSNYAVKLFW